MLEVRICVRILIQEIFEMILQRCTIRHCFTMLISLEKLIGSSRKCYQRCSLGPESPHYIWKRIRIKTRTGTALADVCALWVSLFAMLPIAVRQLRRRQIFQEAAWSKISRYFGANCCFFVSVKRQLRFTMVRIKRGYIQHRNMRSVNVFMWLAQWGKVAAKTTRTMHRLQYI